MHGTKATTKASSLGHLGFRSYYDNVMCHVLTVMSDVTLAPGLALLTPR